VGVQFCALLNVALDEHVFSVTLGHFAPGKGSPIPTRWKAGDLGGGGQFYFWRTCRRVKFLTPAGN
jgi:hypothetical protein